MNVEVFKTNVGDPEQARLLVDQIQQAFTGYMVNFDLEDCDKILRVKCATGFIQSGSLIKLLNDFGFDAEVL